MINFLVIFCKMEFSLYIKYIFVSSTIGRCGPLQTFTIHQNITPSELQITNRRILIRIFMRNITLKMKKRRQWLSGYMKIVCTYSLSGAKCVRKFPRLQNLIQFSLDTLMMCTGVNPLVRDYSTRWGGEFLWVLLCVKKHTI